MQWYTRSTRTAEPAPMPTLEGFALDDQRCFFRRNETLLDSLIDLSNQRGVFATAATRVTTKRVFCGMEIGSSIRTIRGCCCWWFAIVMTVLSVLLEHMFGLTAGFVAHTICGESRAGASTVTTVLNGWHSVSSRYVSKHYKTTYEPR